MDRVQITFTAKPRRKFASFRRIGGLYHWRIGPIGGTFYRARDPRPRYDFDALGNTIDIFDCRTGQTVAWLNIGFGTPRQAFEAWLARERQLGAHITRGIERVAFAAVVLAIAVSVVL